MKTAERRDDLIVKWFYLPHFKLRFEKCAVAEANWMNERRLITKYFLVDTKLDWGEHLKQWMRAGARKRERNAETTEQNISSNITQVFAPFKKFRVSLFSGLCTENLHAHHSRWKFSSFSSYNSLWAFWLNLFQLLQNIRPATGFFLLL